MDEQFDPEQLGTLFGVSRPTMVSPVFFKSSRWNMITFGHVIALGVHLKFLTQKIEAMAR